MASLQRYSSYTHLSGKWFKSSHDLYTCFGVDFHAILMENDASRKKNFVVRLTLEHDLENFLNLLMSLLILEENRQTFNPVSNDVNIANLGDGKNL